MIQDSGKSESRENEKHRIVSNVTAGGVYSICTQRPGALHRNIVKSFISSCVNTRKYENIESIGTKLQDCLEHEPCSVLFFGIFHRNPGLPLKSYFHMFPYVMGTQGIHREIWQKIIGKGNGLCQNETRSSFCRFLHLNRNHVFPFSDHREFIDPCYFVRKLFNGFVLLAQYCKSQAYR